MKTRHGFVVFPVGIICLYIVLFAINSNGTNNSFWTDRFVLAVQSSANETDVLKVLDNLGFTDVLCKSTQPYWFWDFDKMDSIPLSEVHERFLPGDPRISDYVEKISALFRTSHDKKNYGLFYIKAPKNRRYETFQANILRYFPDSVVIVSQPLSISINMFFVLILSGISLILLSKNRMFSAFLQIPVVGIVFFAPVIFPVSFFIVVYFISIDHAIDEDLRFILVRGTWHSRLREINRLFLRNIWFSVFLIPCIPLVFEGIRNCISFVILMLLFLSMFFFKTMYWNHPKKLKVLSFKPVSIFQGKQRISCIDKRLVMLCLCFSLVLFLNNFFESRFSSIPLNQTQSKYLSIPIPKGYSNSGDTDTLLKWDDFKEHIMTQASIQYKKIGIDFDSKVFSDFFFEKGEIKQIGKSINGLFDFDLNDSMNGIEYMIRENCGNTSPVLGNTIPEKEAPFAFVGVLCLSIFLLLYFLDPHSRKRQIDNIKGELVDGMPKTA